MWIVLGLALLVAWFLGLVVFKVASAAIHLLIVAAVIAVAVHFYNRFRGHTATDT